MAYSSSANTPFLISGRTGGAVNPGSSAAGGLGGQVWGYNSTDLMATVAAAGYFTNGYALGMRVGDILHATAWSTAATAVYVGHATGRISASNASSAATVVFVSSST